MILSDGGVKFALYLERDNGKVFTPSDQQVDRLLDIEGAEEVSSQAFQPYKVVFHLESIDDLTDQRVAKAKLDIWKAIRRRVTR